jgi:dCMP deaminase
MANEKFIKRERMSWNEFFMRIALTAAERTACNFHKVAAVFVDENHRIISIGYNGPSVGDLHCNEVGCAKVHGDPVTGELKRCRGAHAEINAMINSGDTHRLKDSTLYITIFPCYDCMKALNNAGIKKIIFLEDYLRVAEGSGGKVKVVEPEARELAGRRGIICEQFRFTENKKINEVNIDKEIIKETQENNRRF